MTQKPLSKSSSASVVAPCPLLVKRLRHLILCWRLDYSNAALEELLYYPHGGRTFYSALGMIAYTRATSRDSKVAGSPCAHLETTPDTGSGEIAEPLVQHRSDVCVTNQYDQVGCPVLARVNVALLTLHRS